MTFSAAQAEGRWWLHRPDGTRFFSLALNHAEETDLKHAGNREIWTERYGDRETWRSAVTRDLRSLGFNTLGWTQQWVAGDFDIDAEWRDVVDLKHSSGWSPDELASAGMPYIQTLPFARMEHWNGNPEFPDVFSRDFAEYCEYIAAALCDGRADDPDLIGYFYVDIPAWLRHSTGRTFPQLVGLAGAARDRQLADIAHKYYEVTTAAVRRHDSAHLILGDRYNGNLEIPEVVLRAAAEHIDVLSVQYFPGAEEADWRRMRDDLAHWHAITGKPIIIADAGSSAPTHLRSDRWDGLASQEARGAHYAGALGAIADEPWLVGWHWCGYLENPARAWGVKSDTDEFHRAFTDRVTSVNGALLERLGIEPRGREGEGS